MSEFKLATITEKTDVEIFTGDYLDLLTSEIQAEVDNHKADLSTEATRKKTKSFAAKIAKAKVRADEAGKSLNAERRSLNDKVDERRRQLRDDFDRMRDQARKPVTDWEEAEQAKQDAERIAIQEELERIEQSRLDDIRKREEEIERREAELAEAEAVRVAMELAVIAEKERLEREEQIRIEAAKQAARDALESIERVRREKKEAIDRAEREKQEAIDDAAAAAKQAEIDKAVAERVAIEKADRERIAAEEEKERAIKAERDRIAAEQLAAEKAAEKREADKKHKARINNEAAESCDILVFAGCASLNEKECRVLAKDIITAIAKGQIPHIKISY